ncbi:MAG TPA: SMP-30/gluconolactonase/LRE family protein, partial [Opitutus sp.]|nr:SMP-30/gluconolactonase/LRE family protein [Opitutus sp.]
TDQAWLYVADYRSHWVYSYQIQPDGTLAHKQRFCWLHTPDTDDEAFTDGLKVDREGRLYVTTRLGIQVCDTSGRVQAIIPTPNGKITNLAFVGEHLDTIFATCNEQVYRRKVKVRGVNAWAPPFKPEVAAR